MFTYLTLPLYLYIIAADPGAGIGLVMWLSLKLNSSVLDLGCEAGKLFSVHEGSQERPMKGHRRSSSYGSTGDTAAMMGGPPMAGFGLRHGASYSEIPLVYDYQFLAPPSQDLYYDREVMLDRAVDLLDPDLRPIPPQPNCADSMQIYQNHRQMAADFVKVQTELMDLKKTKNELEDKLNLECSAAGPETDKVFMLNSEKESLVQFSKKLKTQLRLINNALVKQDPVAASQQHQHQPNAAAIDEGDWVVVHQEK